VNTGSFLIATIMSYGLSPVVAARYWPTGRQFFQSLGQVVGIFGSDAEAFVNGSSVLARPEAFLTAFCLPILISSAAFLALLVLLAPVQNSLTEDIPRLLFRWSIVFAVVALPALPLVQDFWYPVAWGRLVAANLNPYYIDPAPQFTRDLPIWDSQPFRMMYGPLWASAYGIVTWLVGGQAYLGALAFKALMAGAWVGSLGLIRSLMKHETLWEQCLAILVFGWLPASLHASVVEGHNDTFLVVFILLWLYCLESGQAVKATVSLMASLLVKYVSAPLFGLDFLYHLFSRRGNLKAYLPGILTAAVSGGVIFSLFYRSPDFFAYIGETLQWHFLTPREALIALELLTVGRALPYSEAARGIFLLVAAYYVARYVRHPGRVEFRTAAFAVMAAVLFSISGHVWPWYILWLIALAAVIPGSMLARWTIGVAIASPFMLLISIAYPNAGDFYVWDIPALALYLFAAMWLALIPSRWFPKMLVSEPIPQILES
jgi:alpha-1,6-mannosyltransferase